MFQAEEAVKARAWYKAFYLDRRGVRSTWQEVRREEQRQVWGLLPGAEEAILAGIPQASSY